MNEEEIRRKSLGIKNMNLDDSASCGCSTISETVEALANNSKRNDSYSVGEEVKLEDASVIFKFVEKTGIDWDRLKS